jgi:hypothetical protein
MEDPAIFKTKPIIRARFKGKGRDLLPWGHQKTKIYPYSTNFIETVKIFL